MSDFLLAEGFGNLTDGTHLAGTSREILGDQWSSFDQNFAIEDRADGRKRMIWIGSNTRPGMVTGNLGGISTVALAFRVTRHSADHCTFATFRDSTWILGVVTINAAGNVAYCKSATGTAIVASAAVPLDTETHIEVRILFHQSAGSVHIYINGILADSATGIDTIDQGATLDNILFFTTAQTAYLYTGWKWGDFVIHTGTSPIGDVGVYYLPADADGADSDFTPSAGANYQCVDEIGPDEDTTYNESDGTAGHRDSFETAGIAGMDILSVGVLARARKTDSGAATLLLGAIHGASEDQSAAKGLSEDYLTFTEFFDVCPSTSAAWSSAEVTAAEFSHEVGA